MLLVTLYVYAACAYVFVDHKLTSFSFTDIFVQATFKITLEVPSELVALSNMPVVEEKLDGLVKTLSFQESPIMSTYLVAVVIGLFDYVEDFTPDGKTLDNLVLTAIAHFLPLVCRNH